MNSKYCNECGAAYTPGARFCQKCGKPVYNDKGRLLKWPAMIGIILAASLVSCAILFFAVIKPQQEAMAKLTEEFKAEIQAADEKVTTTAAPATTEASKTEAEFAYEEALKQVVDDITIGGNMSAYLLDAMSKEWDNAKDNPFWSQKIALETYIESSAFTSPKSDVVAKNTLIVKNMKSLENPPARYSDLYLSVLDLYSDYSSLYAYIISPPTDFSTVQAVIRTDAAAFKRKR